MWERVVKAIAEYEIYSSTDAVLEALELFCKVFEEARSLEEGLKLLYRLVEELVEVRPTSVMLINMMRRLLRAIRHMVITGLDTRDIATSLRRELNSIRRELEAAIGVAASLGARRVSSGDAILTCSYSRTVLAFFSRVVEEGKDVEVYVTESRPGGEGVAMALKLSDMGLETTLIVDSAVRFFMKDVDKVVVGAEAIAANGAVVNKVGTSMIALAAHEARVRTFVIATTHKFSHETIFGELVKIPIKTRIHDLPPKAAGTGAISAEMPLFDVTPPEYIDAIITERGVVAPEAVILLVKELYGWPPGVVDVRSMAGELLEVVKAGGST